MSKEKGNGLATVDDCIAAAGRIVVCFHRHYLGWAYQDRIVLGTQLYKSLLSIPSNLAEGQPTGPGPKRRYYEIALGSLREAQVQLRVASGCRLMPQRTCYDIRVRLEHVSEIISDEITLLCDGGGKSGSLDAPF